MRGRTLPARMLAAWIALALLGGGCGGSPPAAESGSSVWDAAQERPTIRRSTAGRDTARRDTVGDPQISPAPPALDSTGVYVLTSDSAWQRNGSSLIQLVGVRVLLYDSLGAQSGELTARSGEYDPESGAMVARGNVVVELRERNRRIETEELHYQPSEDRFWSPVESYLEQDDLRMRAESFTSDSRLENLQVERPRGWFRW